MSRARFVVTYSIVTPESAEFGDFAESGAVEECATLRDALKALHGTRTAQCDGIQSIEPDSAPCDRPRTVTVYNGQEFRTGAYESRTLLIPDNLSRSTARRIGRLAGCAHYLTA